MKKKNYILIILFLVSFALRVIFISGCLFHHDSVVLAKAIEKTIETKELQPTVSGRHMLVLLNLAFYLPISNFIDDPDLALNIISAFFASLSIIFVYLFIQKLTNNDRIAIFASLLTSLNPIFLSVTVYAKSHAPAFLFAMMSAYFLMLFRKTKKHPYAILFITTFAIGFLIRNTNIYYILPFTLLICKRKNIIKSIYPVAAVFLAYIVFGFKTLAYERGPNMIPWDHPELLIKLSVLNLINMLNALTILGVILIVFSFYVVLLKKKYFMMALCWLWFLPYYAYVSLIQTSSARFFIPVLLPLVLLISLSIDYIYEKKRVLGITALAVILALMLLTILPIISFRHSYCGPEEYAGFVDTHTEEESIIIANDEAIFFNYYADKNTLSLPTKQSQRAKILEIINTTLENNSQLYITGKELFDDHNITFHLLKSRFRLEYIGSALNEEYHHAELMLRIRNESLYKISRIT